jgi:hypothetical protein
MRALRACLLAGHALTVRQPSPMHGRPIFWTLPLAATLVACSGMTARTWTTRAVPRSHDDVTVSSRQDSCSYLKWHEYHAPFEILHQPLPSDSLDVPVVVSWVRLGSKPTVYGSVAVAFVVDSTGEVQHEDVMAAWLTGEIESHPSAGHLDRKHRQLIHWAIRDIDYRFRPGAKNGRSVWGWVCLVLSNNEPRNR